ncbi:MAG TPA: GNAT family N-acetyltransferase [Anaerolineae bacterium]|nr:GNAT family N-acetyltransferase [Anaerolineae bacterium]
MVVTMANEASRQIQGGLRPMEPVQDLREVAALIGDAFANEMDERGRAALRELRWMARLSPLVWWLSQVDPEFRDAFRGFVWEAPGSGVRGRRVVANVNLNRAPGNRQRYIICNVVVDKEFRNRGIGRQLTQAAMDEAVELGAHGVLLQVYRENRPALHLYLSLGFQELTGETEMVAERVPPVAVVEPIGYQVRPWQSDDGQKMYELARQAVPAPLQWIRPLRVQDYWHDGPSRLLGRLGGLLAGRQTYRLVALRAEEPVAAVAVTASFRRSEHKLALLVKSEHAGQVESALFSRALHLLAALPPRPVRASLYTGDVLAVKALKGYGFQERQTLLTMGHDLR